MDVPNVKTRFHRRARTSLERVGNMKALILILGVTVLVGCDRADDDDTSTTTGATNTYSTPAGTGMRDSSATNSAATNVGSATGGAPAPATPRDPPQEGI